MILQFLFHRLLLLGDQDYHCSSIQRQSPIRNKDWRLVLSCANAGNAPVQVPTKIRQKFLDSYIDEYIKMGVEPQQSYDKVGSSTPLLLVTA